MFTAGFTKLHTESSDSDRRIQLVVQTQKLFLLMNTVIPPQIIITYIYTLLLYVYKLRMFRYPTYVCVFTVCTVCMYHLCDDQKQFPACATCLVRWFSRSDTNDARSFRFTYSCYDYATVCPDAPPWLSCCGVDPSRPTLWKFPFFLTSFLFSCSVQLLRVYLGFYPTCICPDLCTDLLSAKESQGKHTLLSQFI